MSRSRAALAVPFLAVVFGSCPDPALACPESPGDLAPGELVAGLDPPGWRVVGDGVVGVGDVVAMSRAAVGLHVLELDDAGVGDCPLVPGDLAPGVVLSDASWEVGGDGRLDIGDVIVALRAAVGFHVIRRGVEPATAQLTGEGEYAALLAALKAEALLAMEQSLARARGDALLPLDWGCVYDPYADWSSGWGGPVSGVPGQVVGPGSAAEFSNTNTQVEGVDEADMVKTDGGHVYLVADGRLQVFDAWPADETHRVAAVEMEGDPSLMYLDGDRLVLFSSLERLDSEPEARWGPYGHYGQPPCTYGYDCNFTGDGRRARLSIYDVGDPSRPRLERELTFDGAYVNSRRVGSNLHVVLSAADLGSLVYESWAEELGDPRDWYLAGCESGVWPLSADQVHAAFDALHARNLVAIETAGLADFLPSYVDRQLSGGRDQSIREPMVSAGTVHRSRTDDGFALLSVVSLDLRTVDCPTATSIVSKPGAVYADADSLYVAVRHSSYDMGSWFFPQSWQIPEATAIHAFDLSQSPPASLYRGSGVVPGRLLNQFSMDEHGGDLRVATTVNGSGSTATASRLTVLRPLSGRLKTIGSIDGLGPTETIRSVRFDGNRGFVVTFKKTDPLFVLDLEHPKRPTVLGELKIPGFSTYMHLLDEDHLLTVGYDADDQGGFAWFQGIQLQVLDVSDPTTPTLLHREIIGSRGSTSEAVTNHLAYNFFRPLDALALPMTICEDSESAEYGGLYGDQMTFAGLLVYRVTVEGGFERLGGLPHHPAENEPSDSSACYNWWTDSHSIVERSLFLEDWVFSLAPDKLQVAPLAALDTALVEISLED